VVMEKQRASEAVGKGNKKERTKRKSKHMNEWTLSSVFSVEIMRSVSIALSPILTFTGTYSSTFQSSLFITDARSLSVSLSLTLICWLTITSCGKGLEGVLVCVCK